MLETLLSGAGVFFGGPLGGLVISVFKWVGTSWMKKGEEERTNGHWIDVIVVDTKAPIDGARFTITRQGPGTVVMKVTQAGCRLAAFTFPNLGLAYELAVALTCDKLLWVRSRGRGYGKAPNRESRRKKWPPKDQKQDQPRGLGNPPRSIVAGSTLGATHKT